MLELPRFSLTFVKQANQIRLPSDEAQLELSLGEPDEGRRLASLNAAVDSINARYARTVVGYGGCAPPGGYVGAKIGYGRVPGLEDFQ